MWKAAFVDRDGVVTQALPKDVYVLHEDQIVFHPDAVRLLSCLQQNGPIFIVSNQQCVGKGLISLEQARRIQQHIIECLREQNIVIQDDRFCPHLASDGCPCRKPAPGMILDLCKQHNIDPSTSMMIGDSASDIEAGQRAGCGLNILLHASSDVALPAHQHVHVYSSVSDFLGSSDL